jgi:hypothetical protein
MLLGSAVSCAGDVNNDGFDDILIGANLASMNGSYQSGSAFVYSGTDSQQLFRFDGATAYFGLGNEVSGIGDINADGFDDILIGAANSSLTLNQSGSAFVYSGASGGLLYQFDGSYTLDSFGGSVSDAGDVNGDGFADVIIRAHGSDPGGRLGAGSAFIYSGATGGLLFRVDGLAADDHLGSNVSSAGITKNIGYSNVVVAANFADPNGQPEAGSVSVIGFNPFLQSTATSISASAGGLVGLQLDFPEVEAFADYKILISTSGPGIISYGVDIPLTLDSMVLQTFGGNYPFATSVGMQGSLNAIGDGVATISIPPGAYTSFVGRTVRLAAIANQPGYLPSHSSIAVAITVTP